jgi:hypothetical protein
MIAMNRYTTRAAFSAILCGYTTRFILAIASVVATPWISLLLQPSFRQAHDFEAGFAFIDHLNCADPVAPMEPSSTQPRIASGYLSLYAPLRYVDVSPREVCIADHAASGTGMVLGARDGRGMPRCVRGNVASGGERRSSDICKRQGCCTMWAMIAALAVPTMPTTLAVNFDACR